MLGMGNGDRSMARCFERHVQLCELHSKLSGLQQMTRAPKAECEATADEFDVEARFFLKQLAEDFGLTNLNFKIRSDE